jgi:hypothetical protein
MRNIIGHNSNDLQPLQGKQSSRYSDENNRFLSLDTAFKQKLARLTNMQENTNLAIQKNEIYHLYEFCASASKNDTHSPYTRNIFKCQPNAVLTQHSSLCPAHSHDLKALNLSPNPSSSTSVGPLLTGAALTACAVSIS